MDVRSVMKLERVGRIVEMGRNEWGDDVSCPSCIPPLSRCTWLIAFILVVRQQAASILNLLCARGKLTVPQILSELAKSDSSSDPAASYLYSTNPKDEPIPAAPSSDASSDSDSSPPPTKKKTKRELEKEKKEKERAKKIKEKEKAKGKAGSKSGKRRIVEDDDDEIEKPDVPELEKNGQDVQAGTKEEIRVDRKSLSSTSVLERLANPDLPICIF